MKWNRRTYVLDIESENLLKSYAIKNKISLSSALRMIITKYCKEGY